MKPHPAYEVFEEIGRGEGTVVYRAHDLALGRDVAIKALDETSRSDPRRRNRFLKEAQFLAQSAHAGVLQIHAVDLERGWIVMELMDGTLASQIQHAPLPAATVRSVLTQLLPAVGFLHSRNKIHGAIRPSNILIDKSGVVKLSDFEETSLDGELRAPTTSKKYIAPELIRPEFGQLGPQADLYCLAFTALELLAGPKFASLTIEAAGSVVEPDVAWLRWHSGEQSFPDVGKLVPNMPSDLAGALNEMLRKPVAERCSSADQAIELLNEQPIIAVHPVAVSPASLAAGTAPSLDMLPTSVRELEPPGPKANTASPKPSPFQPHSHQPHSHQPHSHPSQGKQSKRQRAAVAVPVGSRARLNQLLEKPYVLYPLCAALLLLALAIGFALQPAGVDPLAQLPVGEPSRNALPQEQETEREAELETEGVEGSLLESIDTTEDLRSVSEESEPVIEVTAIEEPSTAELNPAETTIAEVNPAETIIAEVNTEEVNTEEVNALETASEQAEVALDISPPDATEQPTESLEAAFVAKPEFVSPLLELVSIKIDPQPILQDFKGKPELVIDSGGFMSEVSDVAISPDGKWLAASGEKVVRVWDIELGQLATTLRGDRSRAAYGDCYAIAFSPDGQFLLVGVNDYRPHGSIRVYRTDNLAEIDSLLPGHTAPVRRLVFSRDGKWLASVDANGKIAIWDWVERAVQKTLPARNTDSPIYDELMFPGVDPILMGIDFEGPLLLDVPALNQLTASDPLPSRLFAWMSDVLGQQLRYPFDTEREPRVFDLKLDSGVWGAASVGRDGGRNKFWIGVWPSHTRETPPIVDPTLVYTGHRWNVTAIDLAPTHQLAASGDKFSEVHLWDLKSGQTLHRFTAQGKPIYEAAFDQSSRRIAFGNTPFPPSKWDRNNYGAVEKLLDLDARAIYSVQPSDELLLVQEQPLRGNMRLNVRTSTEDPSSQLIEKFVGPTVANSYQFTSGRLVTVFSLLDAGKLELPAPAVIGDNLGLLAVWDSDGDELRRAFIGHAGLVSGISVASNGKQMLSGSADRTLRLWSLENYQPTGIFDFKFENAVVTRVLPGTDSQQAGVQPGDRILSIDGLSLTDMQNLMLEGKFDYVPGQRVPLKMQRGGEPYSYEMRMQKGYDFSEPLLNIYLGDDDSWIVWTPAGHYDASPGADRLIGWHVNRGPHKSAAFFEVQQFRKQLYRPDIINLIWSGVAPQDAIAQASAKRGEVEPMDFRSPSDLARHHPPSIEFLSPSRGEVLSRSEVELQAVVRSLNGLPIKEVTLLVNDVASRVFTPKSPTMTSLDITYNVELRPGRNDIELIAANAESTSAAQSMHVLVEAAVEPKPIHLNVLAIGISEYATSGGFADLPTAAADARRFEQIALEQANGKLYTSVNSRVLSDRSATRTAILDGLQWLVDSTQPGDTAAIYIAAHGFVDSSENFYIGTFEVDRTRPRATAISWRELIKTLHEDLPHCQRLVFLDVSPTDAAVDPSMRNPLLDLAAPELATSFFSSNSLQQINLPQSTDKLGFLTQALSGVLRDPSSDIEPTPPDALLTPSEIATAWSERVKQLSGGRLYPVAYTPATHRPINVLELKP